MTLVIMSKESRTRWCTVQSDPQPKGNEATTENWGKGKGRTGRSGLKTDGNEDGLTHLIGETRLRMCVTDQRRRRWCCC
jgi:hypothetical protein